MEATAKIRCKGELSARVIRKNGRVEELGVLRWPWWKRLWHWLTFDQRGIVTNAGVNYMASDFAAGLASPRISAFNFHDSGTGTNAPAVTDTGLQTPAGPVRVTGTQSNPAANQYKTVATITYSSALTITEWGLFSASTAGTLWDRRTFSAISVASGDSIQFSYTLSVNSGGT